MKSVYLVIILSLLSFLYPPCAYAQVQVRGVVRDDSGEGLPGVHVQQKESSQAATTDIEGNYSIELDGNGQQVLVFSFIGMKTIEQKVTGPVLDIVMAEDTKAIDEIVIVAYGTRKKGTITGSVSSIQAGAIADAPVASFDQALQGKASGLMVLQNSGDPTAAASFSIRGTNSINADTEPLFVIDGVPVSAGDFSAINPSDIENLSVLKDASSTSIYGARAANGVIAITTRRGQMGDRAQVRYRTQYGLSRLAYGHWTQMNTSQRLDFEEMVGIRQPGTYDRETLERTDINWRDLVFRDNAPTMSHDLSVSGASEKSSYYISAGMFDQQGIALNSSFQRFTLRSNLEIQANNWLRVGTNTSLTYSGAEETDYGSYSIISPISASKFMLPYWDPFKQDGSFTSPKDGTWRGSYENPLEWAQANPLTRTKVHLLSSTFLQVEPVRDLKLKTLFGLDGGDTRSNTYSLPSYVSNYGNGTVGKAYSQSYSYTWTNTANYSFDIDSDHQFNLLLGHEMTRNASDAFSVVSRGQTNDRLLTLATGTLASNWSDSRAASTYLSFFGRNEYSYLNRFFADISVRADASSKFGSNSRWAAFWSVGGMWNMGAERWLRPLEWLQSLQLSASYGTSGNSSIPNYDHLALYSAGPQYSGMAGIAPYSLGNDNLTWEKLSALNMALKASMFNRLSVTVEAYRKRTYDMLMEVPITLGNGFATMWDNIGAMVNRGIETELNAYIIKGKALNLTVNGSVSYNHNEITELYNGLDEYEIPATGLLLKVGHPYGEHYQVRYAGVNPANGDALWYTRDGQVTNQYNEEDKVLLGKGYVAPWQGGFGSSLTWKFLSLDMQFSWVANRWMINNDRWFDESNGLYSTAYNQSTALFRGWRNPGDITDIPRYGVSPEMDSHLLEDASFLRMKNVMIYCRIPSEWIAPARFVDGVRVFAQGQNLFTWTRFTGMDPESSYNVYQATYPMSRQFTFGVELSF